MIFCSPRHLIMSVWVSLVGFVSLMSVYTSMFIVPTGMTTGDGSLRIALEPSSPFVRRANPTEPNIVLLMSFPNSGTTYTIANSEQISNFSTATNYAEEVTASVLTSLLPDFGPAPFVFSPNKPVPKYVLTKTHCLGYCDNCHHNTSTHTAETFDIGCRRANIKGECGPYNIHYPSRKIAKVIHLLRNPFDNIVARKHLGVAERQKQHIMPPNVLRILTDTQEGLLAWCAYVDDAFHENQAATVPIHEALPGDVEWPRLKNETIEILKKVPCHSEWFRYIQWHSRAFELLDRDYYFWAKELIVHYEDYTHKFDATVQRVADFLEQPRVNPPKPFVPGKTYGHLYSDEFKQQVAGLFKELAHPTAWEFMKHYFDGYTEETANITSVWNNHLVETNSTATAAAATSYTKIVWLLSYPNSVGTNLLSPPIKYVYTTLTHFLAGLSAGHEEHHVDDKRHHGYAVWTGARHPLDRRCCCI
jgi:hypothetical protein